MKIDSSEGGQKPKSWLDSMFNLFGSKEIDQIPGRGTILIDTEERPSIFDIFVTPQQIADREPGRGSIRIDDEEKPSIFSQFASLGGRQKDKNAVPNPQPVRQKSNDIFSFFSTTEGSSTVSSEVSF